MQHAHDYEAAFGASCGLGQLLEEVDVVAGAQRRGLEELAHFVDDDQCAVLRAALGLFEKLRDQRLGGGLAAAVDIAALRAA